MWERLSPLVNNRGINDFLCLQTQGIRGLKIYGLISCLLMGDPVSLRNDIKWLSSGSVDIEMLFI